MTARSSARPHLRVVSWNVRDLLGDPLVVARVLRDLEPDVVCLQEVPRRALRGYRLRMLARNAGLDVLGAGAGSGGTAVLGVRRSVGDPRDARVLRLPVGHWWTRRRGAVVVRLPALTVASVHLPLTSQERERHAGLVVAALAAAAGPGERLVVAGDLNEPPDGPAWVVLGGLVTDPGPATGPTFPARAPGARIDAVLVDPRLEVLRYGPADVDPALVRIASDHWPVVADLRLDLTDDGPRS